MRPALLELFGTLWPSYFVLLAAGFVFATWGGALWARRVGHNPDVIVDLGLSMLIFGVLGGRLLHVLCDGHLDDYVHLCTAPELVSWKIGRAECLRADTPGQLDAWLGASARALGRWDEAAGVCRPIERDCFAWARFWAGGLTYYGGFLGASLAAWFLLRRDRFPFWKAADMAGQMVPLGLCFGRMGCLLGGCCFGKPWDSPIGVVFPGGSPASHVQAELGLLDSSMLPSLPVHPTQLYEAAGALALTLLLVLWLHPRKRYDGQVFVAFVGGYATLRFLLEFARADERGGVAALSTSQWLGVGLGLGALWLHRRLESRRTRPIC
ncbi:MAG TPA: prolipoprotein diacylglyceryl transferase family protein [Polyangiaceae bacterium]|nr:prolipoprotein diacylglyceryl transferase family protein [Polyangiaceae bacterium]